MRLPAVRFTNDIFLAQGICFGEDVYGEDFSMNLIMLAAAVAPAAWLMKKVYDLDAIEKEPANLLLRLLLLGILSTIPAILLEGITGVVLKAVLDGTGLIYAFAQSFIGVALIEEGCKYFFLRRGTWNRPEFNYRFDGVVYAVFVSLGFALLENINYVFTFGLQVALSRALLAVPMHAVCGVYMGIWLGEAKKQQLSSQEQNVKSCLSKSLWLPVLLHGIYDGCLIYGTQGSMLVFIAFVFVLFILTLRRVKSFAQEDQSFYSAE